MNAEMNHNTDLQNTGVHGGTRGEEEPCSLCIGIANMGGFGPTHNGSKFCESGSIASGGDRAHCTCDWCF